MISFGSDPEFMLTKNGRYRSAINVVQGTKENRVKINGHEFFWDNVMAECAIKPGKNKKQVIANVGECLSLYAEMVRPFLLTTQASHMYPISELLDDGAKEVGCDPDWCAYEMAQKEAPKEAIKSSCFRSCGGHVHLGKPVLIAAGCEPILAVYMLDLFVGIPSLWLDNDPTSAPRRKLYGQAGRYRVADPYGIEYRSLGNFWFRSPQLVGLIYDLCDFAVKCVENGSAFDLWSFDEDVYWDELSKGFTGSAAFTSRYDAWGLKQAIDTSDRQAAQKFYDLAKSLLPIKLENALDAAIEAEDKGFYPNWGLK